MYDTYIYFHDGDRIQEGWDVSSTPRPGPLMDMAEVPQWVVSSSSALEHIKDSREEYEAGGLLMGFFTGFICISTWLERVFASLLFIPLS